MNPVHHETDPRQLLQQMLLIRAYEEAIVAGSTAGKVPGTCTSVGQEAAAVGVVNALGVWWRKFGADGSNVNELTSQRLTDLGGGPTFYDCLVEVEAVAG